MFLEIKISVPSNRKVLSGSYSASKNYPILGPRGTDRVEYGDQKYFFSSHQPLNASSRSLGYHESYLYGGKCSKRATVQEYLSDELASD